MTLKLNKYIFFSLPFILFFSCTEEINVDETDLQIRYISQPKNQFPIFFQENAEELIIYYWGDKEPKEWAFYYNSLDKAGLNENNSNFLTGIICGGNVASNPNYYIPKNTIATKKGNNVLLRAPMTDYWGNEYAVEFDPETGLKNYQINMNFKSRDNPRRNIDSFSYTWGNNYSSPLYPIQDGFVISQTSDFVSKLNQNNIILYDPDESKSFKKYFSLDPQIFNQNELVNIDILDFQINGGKMNSLLIGEAIDQVGNLSRNSKSKLFAAELSKDSINSIALKLNVTNGNYKVFDETLDFSYQFSISNQEKTNHIVVLGDQFEGEYRARNMFDYGGNEQIQIVSLDENLAKRYITYFDHFGSSIYIKGGEFLSNGDLVLIGYKTTSNFNSTNPFILFVNSKDGSITKEITLKSVINGKATWVKELDQRKIAIVGTTEVYGKVSNKSDIFLATINY